MADIDVTYDPISITSTVEPITLTSGPVTVDVVGLNDIKLSIPDPIVTNSTIKTDSAIAFTIPEPIRTASEGDLTVKAGLDLQPVVLDQCLRLSLGPLPPTLICLPNRQHVGISLFGTEIFGLTLEGDARIIVGEPEHRPFIAGSVGGGITSPRSDARPNRQDAGGGLRIRLER